MTLRKEKLCLLELLIWQDGHLGLPVTCDLLASTWGEPPRKYSQSKGGRAPAWTRADAPHSGALVVSQPLHVVYTFTGELMTGRN